ncbi:MAG: sugar ABC transporter permease [Spirochaetales bacterium]|nr:sugar ABC transporter permease [Spirochaetales bacterium]
MNSKTSFINRLLNQRLLLLMSVPFVIHIILFRYVPVFGWVMAFQNYKPNRPMLDQQWVGFEQFTNLFGDYQFLYALRNTLAMSAIKLVMGTIFAVLVAIMVNETKRGPFKRTVQTISYLPHFISWVVAANLVLEFLAPNGLFNDILTGIGIVDERVLWMGKPELFWWIIGWSHVWKTCGFGAIIYLAAMTGIDPQLYEAADMDGAGRLRRIWHITLPGIKPVFVILLIMNIGQLLEAGFEQQFLLKNGLVQDYAEVFTIYILRYGLQMYRYSYAAAAGIFKSVVSILLLFTANRISKKLGEETLM